MLSVAKLDARPVPVDHSLKKAAKFFFLHNAQHMKSQRILADGLTFGATLLAIILWGALLLLFAN